MSCALLADLATSAIKPGGGVSAEAVLGDKEQGIGANQDIEVEGSLGKVVGGNDTSTQVAKADALEVTNTSIPPYALIIFIVALLLTAGVPSAMFMRWRKALRSKDDIQN
jgi:hypothetical protein